VVVESNTVWGQSTGISVVYDAVARNNVVFDNATGIYGYSGTIDANRVFRNTTGIRTQYGTTTGNTVFSNSTGISLYGWGYDVSNNLVYANTNVGIEAVSVWSGYRIVNNTVYQQVGNAVSVVGSSNITLQNNILWTDAGFGISVDAGSQSGFTSDHNLFWTSATGTSLFVDMNGADNVLGYTADGTGYDGSRDDNFFLVALSAAIDAANSTAAPPTDHYGNARVDDPGTDNADGSIADIGAVEFLGSSLDTTPPTIAATVPADLFTGGTFRTMRSIDVVYSEGINAIDALASGNYELVRAGTAGFGSGDDVYYRLSPTALTTDATGVVSVRLDLGLAGDDRLARDEPPGGRPAAV
jgi:hypothetical protein